MKIKFTFFLLLVLGTFRPLIAAERSDTPVLETLTIPSYPDLARLAGITGSIPVKVRLDDKCHLTDIVFGKGPELLLQAVIVSVHGGSLPLRFRSCTSSGERDIDLLYVFLLEGQPTNEWSPTYAHVSGSESAFTISITAPPADLDDLGLERKPGTAEGSRLEPKSRTPQDFLLDLTLPRYPPLARTQHVQGDVRLTAELNSKCAVSAAQVVQGGHPLLDSDILAAVRRWRFSSCTAK
jgi:TonB family protein